MVYTEALIRRLLDTSEFKGHTGFKPMYDNKGAIFFWRDVALATVRVGATEPEYHIKNHDKADQMEKLLAEAVAMEVV